MSTKRIGLRFKLSSHFSIGVHGSIFSIRWGCNSFNLQCMYLSWRTELVPVVSMNACHMLKRDTIVSSAGVGATNFFIHFTRSEYDISIREYKYAYINCTPVQHELLFSNRSNSHFHPSDPLSLFPRCSYPVLTP